MRIAVIGSGRIGALHARNLVASPRLEQLLVADSDRARARALADELGCTALDDVDAVWAARPDGVVVGSPTATHAALVHAALDAGVAVFCEKPLTLTVHESVEIGARSRATGVPVMVGFPRRFDAAFRTLREAVARRVHGAPYLLRIRHADVAPPHPGYLATAGTMFVDQCIHDFDAIRFLAGCEVESVSGIGTRVLEGFPEFEQHGDVDTSLSVMRLESGALATVEAFRQAPSAYEATAEVVGASGIAATAFEAPGPITWPERFAEAFAAEIEAFLDVVAGTRESPCTAEDAASAMQIALAAERSFRERRVVRVEEIDWQPRSMRA